MTEIPRTGDVVQVTIEGTVLSTTQGSFISVSFRDAFANVHTLWFSGVNKVERVTPKANQEQQEAQS